jgi:hypothetical protein
MPNKKPVALINVIVGVCFQAVINTAAGVFLLYIAGDELDHGREVPGIMYALAYLSVVIGIVLAVSIVLLLRRVEWARIPVAVIEVLGILSGLIALVSGAPAGMVNVALGIVVLLGLFKADTTEWLLPSPF